MQLGTRWTSGDPIPRAVPVELHEQIGRVDAALPADLLGQPRPRWTLTFLEGRPIAELDTGILVERGADGVVVVRHDDGDEFA